MSSNRLEKLLDFFKNEPQDPFLKYALATEYLVMDEQDKALAFFEDLVQNHADYVGTYYHLGKLYETIGRNSDAEKTYEKGMQVARQARDSHALAELQGVYNSLMGLNYEDD